MSRQARIRSQARSWDAHLFGAGGAQAGSLVFHASISSILAPTYAKTASPDALPVARGGSSGVKRCRLGNGVRSRARVILPPFGGRCVPVAGPDVGKAVEYVAFKDRLRFCAVGAAFFPSGRSSSSSSSDRSWVGFDATAGAPRARSCRAGALSCIESSGWIQTSGAGRGLQSPPPKTVEPESAQTLRSPSVRALRAHPESDSFTLKASMSRGAHGWSGTSGVEDGPAGGGRIAMKITVRSGAVGAYESQPKVQ